MIYFLMTNKHRYTMENVARADHAPALKIVTYDSLFRRRRHPLSPHIFTDFDRMTDWDRELAGVIYARLKTAGAPVYNDPARVKTRYAALRALHEAGINDFNAYRIESGERPIRYPVFLRRDGGHGEPLSGLLDSWEAVGPAVEAALSDGVPESALILVEYMAEEAAPGLYRKIGIYRIGATMVPHLCVHDDNWLVKYGRKGGATDALYEDELRIMKENPFAEALRKAFEIACIDYGRADFGLVGGKPQVYEINTNPDTRPGLDHPNPNRLETQRLFWSKYLDALSELDGPTAGPPLAVADKRLRRYQGMRGLFIRSRKQK